MTSIRQQSEKRELIVNATGVGYSPDGKTIVLQFLGALTVRQMRTMTEIDGFFGISAEKESLTQNPVLHAHFWLNRLSEEIENLGNILDAKYRI